MIYILYSADYELFLGKNYISEKKVLLEPTEKLLTTCDALNIPMTLFCDVMCLWRYHELDLHEFPDEVEKQLKNAISRGHDVQAHLHPHWMKAIKKERSWIFDYKDFLLGNISNDVECYTNSKFFLKRIADYLDNLLKPIKSSYKCLAYRAGGYGIQPKEHQVLSALKDSGYVIDSSIVPGLTLKTNVNKIDFSNVPQKSNYYLSGKTGLQESMENGIFEIPIPRCRENVSYTTKRRVQRLVCNLGSILSRQLKSQDQNDKRGVGIQNIDDKTTSNLSILGKINNSIEKIIRVGQPKYSNLELYNRKAEHLVWITKKYLDQFNLEDDIYFSFSCHPKSIYDDNLKELIRYHHLLMKEFKGKISAISFQDAAERISCKI